jgi:hypothetical protein
MLPSLSAKYAVNVLSDDTDKPLHLNEDFAHHLQAMAIARAARGTWFQRLRQTGPLAALGAWRAARRYENQLIRAWETSPHLLADMGVVLTRGADLPDHLVAAPARVIDHVAALAPEQIAAAETLYAAVAKPVPAQKRDPAPALVTATPAKRWRNAAVQAA